MSISTAAIVAALTLPHSAEPAAPTGAPVFPGIFSAAPRSALQPAGEGDLLSYTFVEAGYLSTDLDGFDDATDAVQARVSIGLFDFLYVFGEYTAESLDAVQNASSLGDVDNDAVALGAGAHLELAPSFDLVGEAAWLYNDLQSDQLSNLDDTNNGWTAFAGARWLAVPWSGGGLELNGGVRWTDQVTLLTDDEVNAWEAGARVHILTALSVGARYIVQEDDSTWGVNLRLSF
jgi:hypothetical protein